eukprot:TRINITY_DN87974_c0_g1_i1.p1 TRINITY_DN87974_c0_g1~~TRINITY_DN87974_c0_g1_i1.p1  ORF type:complete len:527 (-),score=96.95 TRINITY_DN87974_c0_g1_i1:351-1898(-)
MANAPVFPAELESWFPPLVHGVQRQLVADGKFIYYPNITMQGGDRDSPQPFQSSEASAGGLTLLQAFDFLEARTWCLALEIGAQGSEVWFKERPSSLHVTEHGGIYIHVGRVFELHSNMKAAELEAAEFVVDVMVRLAFWPPVELKSETKVQQLKGGSSLTQAVFAVECLRDATAHPKVVLKRYADQASRNRRMLAASTLFSSSGLGPAVLAADCDWIVEAFGGVPPDPESDTAKAKMLGSLAARIHSCPTEWFDSCREELANRHPCLKDLPVDSSIWPCVVYRQSHLDKYLPEEMRQLCAALPSPLSSSSRRAVTIHGDLHTGNLLLSDASEPIVTDFEQSCVSNAAQDLIYDITDMSADDSRVLCASYLKARGASLTEANAQVEADKLAVDAVVAQIVNFFILRSLFWDGDLSMSDALAKLCPLRLVIDELRTKPRACSRVVDVAHQIDDIDEDEQLDFFIGLCRASLDDAEGSATRVAATAGGYSSAEGHSSRTGHPVPDVVPQRKPADASF